jgi:hypothetical protein
MHEEESMQAGVCAACAFTLTDAVFNLLHNLTEGAAEYDRCAALHPTVSVY